MKKYKIMISIFLIIMIIVRVIIINNYKIGSDLKRLESIKKGLVISDLKVINKRTTDNYIEYKNMKVESLSKDFECNEKNNTYTCTIDDKIITMSTTNSFLDNYKEYSNQSINATDDLALLGLIKTSYNIPSLITSISKIRKEFTLNMFALNYLPIINKIDLIEGNFSGLLFYENDKIRELYLYKDSNTYLFSFKNIDDNTIIELINTIEIN